MVLEVKDVSKLRDRVPVLKNISFTLEPGIYGLLGANGAGKTTLFHVICGLLDADRGCIKFDHKDVKKDRELFLSQLGFLPQNFVYYPNFTGIKFMLYMASLKGIDKNSAIKKCNELLELVVLLIS